MRTFASHMKEQVPIGLLLVIFYSLLLAFGFSFSGFPEIKSTGDGAGFTLALVAYYGFFVVFPFIAGVAGAHGLEKEQEEERQRVIERQKYDYYFDRFRVCRVPRGASAEL